MVASSSRNRLSALRGVPLAPASRADRAPASAFLPGRGTSANPANRFERLHYEADPDPLSRPVGTLFLRDPSREILAHNESPDVPFSVSLNPYRGCEHGCIYCYARPTHEYLGFSAGLDFETRLLVKTNAPELLREKLSSKRWKPQVLGLSGVTDPYQPIERQTRLTRSCIEVLAEYRNPVGLITKNALVARDIDLLETLAQHQAVSVTLSITTLDSNLHRVMEPRASAPAQRLRALERLARSGIPTQVMVGPVIPGLTDHELPAILAAASRAGARYAGYSLVRLPHGVASLFEAWIKNHYPDRASKVLNRIRSIRRGKLNDSDFDTRMRGQGVFAEQIEQLFRVGTRQAGLQHGAPKLSTQGFRVPAGPQLDLFPAA